MKLLNNYKSVIAAGLVATTVFAASCTKVLEQQPPSAIIPENYLNEESQLAAYAIARYDILPSHGNWSFGTFGTDGNTDNMATPTINERWVPGQWRVGAEGGDWSFGNIYQMNYFLEKVIPKWTAKQIIGNTTNIDHYIGEMYFLRAFEYFNKLQALGDFPIVRSVLPDSREPLVAASQRAPRTEVARFILSDLDSAITLLQTSSPNGKSRISKPVAQLFKSRVALYEGTWLKYFKGTALVPNGPGWPGKEKSYNANYQFKSGSIDGEIEFFLNEAMVASKAVADAVQLVNNTGIIESPNNENPYFNMFSAVNMSGYSEVLLWRQYATAIVTHNVPVYAQSGNYGVGLTKSMVESFLMANGLPIYAAGSGYQGDDSLQTIRADRDGRLQLFLKQPGQRNILLNATAGTHGTAIEPIPQIWVSSWESKYSTGYAIRKGLSYDGAQTNNGQGFTGSITFRASEAYLNYIEASYEKTGALDVTAMDYWQKLRARAKVSTDIAATIAATEMAKETQDWGAYSANQLINPTLYNIRRERRNELMAEGLRMMDLKRWRALDQMIATPYHVEGFKLWGPMRNWYTPAQLVYGGGNSAAVVSDPALSQYLRPYEIRNNAIGYNGVRWNLAHYLSPIAIQHFTITANGADLGTSPIYQNPGWPMVAGQGVQ
ncbi:RagB/SusD family nutrient uptake outer membrane protein [Chitinophaga sedimenti]|uniref:RagB/SusD family nutrient uptake outer membrane protein n=1 Tax=Chitinophaga sedimenti TaxID=2033606 RepID=UPI00200343F5|nr:RagB/SusD family nutrient uptake outer membrane protein [Chitinophaga sedimenti]MCK7554714.1 RagB/SusD family nutrient uptake outer membrane protein [Chitinophaga sedimenti]